jgi:hypothetical protein
MAVPERLRDALADRCPIERQLGGEDGCRLPARLQHPHISQVSSTPSPINHRRTTWIPSVS